MEGERGAECCKKTRVAFRFRCAFGFPVPAFVVHDFGSGFRDSGIRGFGVLSEGFRFRDFWVLVCGFAPFFQEAIPVDRFRCVPPLVPPPHFLHVTLSRGVTEGLVKGRGEGGGKRGSTQSTQIGNSE